MDISDVELTITDMKYRMRDKVVTQASCTLSLIAPGDPSVVVKATRDFNCRFNYRDPRDPTFVPWRSLTRQNVSDWVLIAVTQEHMDKMKEEVLKDYLERTEPDEGTGVPWTRT